MRTLQKILIGAAAVALSGCAYGGLGLGYGDPYSDYEYGYGSPYGYSYGSRYGYGYGPYGGYGAYPGYYGGFGYSPFGWYDNYYYPGSGIYVYDSYRRPRVWTSRQRDYWMSRQPRTSTRTTTRTTSVQPNWSGFSRRTVASTQRDPSSWRMQRMQTREDWTSAREDRQEAREDRMKAREARRKR